MSLHPSFHIEFTRQHELELRRRLVKPTRSGGDATGSAGGTSELAELVPAARAGDSQAWASLVTQFSPALRATARTYRLQPADVDNAVQATWESAMTHIAQLREPEAIGGWLTVIVKRQALRTIRSNRRENPVAEVPDEERPHVPTLEQPLLEAEQHAAVRAAVGRLPDRQRSLIAALLDGSKTSYADLSVKLRMPPGSIGPTRERALDRLRRDRRLSATLAVTSDSEN
jgi:RNA polymerase sigma factor (sigma-70 family)